MKVLVVDDSRMFRRVIGNEIEEGGYEVIFASDGAEALEVLGRTEVDLVSLDVEMPEMDGYETCLKIRSELSDTGGKSEVPVIFVTSNDTLEGRQKGFESGAADFVSKNLQSGELLRAVDRILRPEKRFEGLTAMVVDDSRIARRLAVACLEELGLDVIQAGDGAEGLEMLASGSAIPDLILSDKEMPVMNGLEFCKKVRQELGLRNVPFIFLSSPSDGTSLLDFFNSGGTDYVPKPFIREELIARLEVYLETQALNKKLQEFNEQLEQRVKEATAEIRMKNVLLERRVRDLGALNNMSVEIGSVMDVDRVLRSVVVHSRQVMNAEEASLLILDKESGEYRFQVASGAVGQSLSSMSVKKGQGIAGWVAEHREALLVPDAYADPRFDPSFDQKTGFRTRSVLAVPLILDDEVYAVLEVINKEGEDSFDQHDFNVVVSFATVVSFSLENGRLFEETKQLAEDLRDALEKERWLAIEKEKMGQYIPKHVVDEITRNREQKLALGGKTVDATILFSDIQGFTSLSEILGPQEVVGFLNEYMSAMSGIVESEGGIIDKFNGDAIMAIFLTREDDENHARRAVRAGVRMQKKLQELRQGWQESRPKVSEMKIRVGINTGEVVAGNIGSEARMDYTVIGDNVNVASRLELNGQGGQVLISETTYQTAGGNIPADKLEPLKVKNREQPVPVYSVDIGLSEFE